MWMEDFNNTRVEYPFHKTMHQLFEEQAEAVPDNTALICDHQKITYSQLNKRSNQLAWLLIDRGVKVNDNVGLIMQRGIDMVVSLYAILKCGAAYVPIDPDYPKARKDYILQNAKVSFVVTDGDYEFDFGNVVNVLTSDFENYPVYNTGVVKDSRELAYIIYTSGSTGLPKGVMIEHHSAVNLINWVNKRFNVNEKDTLLFITSICFDLSVYDVFGILASGGKLVIARKEQVQNPQELKRLLKQEKITFWDSVPSTMNYLVNAIKESSEPFNQEDLRLVFLSGDWIPVKLPDQIKKYFPKAEAISLGGATEGTVWSIYHPIEKVDESLKSIPYGRPIDNNYFYILDDALKPVKDGETGELYIGGVGVARGYMNDEERTRAAFVKNIFLEADSEMMYKTGDLGRMMGDGNIEFLGRKDHQVKIRGFRVEIGEVESQLSRFQAIKEAVVADRTDTLGNKYLCAYIASTDVVDIQELKEHLSKILPDYMIPSMFVQMDQLPLNSNGKIDRKALPEPSIASISTGVDYVSPSNEVEIKLQKVWEKVLGIQNIGVQHDFLEIGGSSVLAVVLEAEMEKEGIPLNLDDITAYRTIKEQAACICCKAINQNISGAVDNMNCFIDLALSEACVDVEEGQGVVLPSKTLEPIEPFNDLYYRNCFYNSLFPVVHYFGKNIKPFLANDAGIYIYNEDREGIKFDVDYLSFKGYEDLLKDMGIKVDCAIETKDIIESIVGAISKGRPVILWIDSFYEPFRLDTYQKVHWPHTLLIHGYNREDKTFDIIEHSHRDGLTYKKRTINWEDTRKCYEGYIEHFSKEDGCPTYMEFYCNESSKDDNTQVHEPIQNLFINMRNWKDMLLDGFESIGRFKEDYKNAIESGVISQSAYARELVGLLNGIIDNRRAEKYKLLQVLGHSCDELNILDDIINTWIHIRTDLIKLTATSVYKAEVFSTHIEKLQLIYEKEINYLKVLLP